MGDKKIVCLGGGIGTVNLLKGVKDYTSQIVAIVSMADDGGSGGRLRRFYSVPPTGDLINCVAAMADTDPVLADMLVYRFSGNRYGSDNSLPGQKLGNLMLVALTSITGSFDKALVEMQRLFKVSGKILPSTNESVSIWAKTSVGDIVAREENIDLGRFDGKIDHLYLKPEHPTAPREAIEAIEQADIIVAGPGDLYTTILPVLLVPQILSAINKSKAKKYFVINVANKLFETPDYSIRDYIRAVEKHCKKNVFDVYLVNDNYAPQIPKNIAHKYEYVSTQDLSVKEGYVVIKKDLLDESFPLYHSPQKLAKAILEPI